MTGAPIEALTRVDAFLNDMFAGDGKGDAIRSYVRNGVVHTLTEDDVRAVVSIARLALAPGAPAADYPGVWAELTGYVQEAVDDGGPIDAADLLAYLRELRHKALAPAREWMAGVEAGAK